MTHLVVQQSSATAAYRRVYLHLVDATDGITPETGIAAATAMLSVNGAAAAASTNNIVEIDAGDLPGAYYLELTAAELGTLGTIRGGFKAAACAWAPFTVTVVDYDPDDLLDRADGIETGLTLRQALRGIAAVLYGKKSGSGTASEVFRNAAADDADRVTVVGEADGDRTAITLNL
jgi:acyl-CoA synthetase (NDP forming)